jgi:hypothetical protein
LKAVDDDLVVEAEVNGGSNRGSERVVRGEKRRRKWQQHLYWIISARRSRRRGGILGLLLAEVVAPSERRTIGTVAGLRWLSGSCRRAGRRSRHGATEKEAAGRSR